VLERRETLDVVRQQGVCDAVGSQRDDDVVDIGAGLVGGQSGRQTQLQLVKTLHRNPRLETCRDCQFA
jgi:hypothetical protein